MIAAAALLVLSIAGLLVLVAVLAVAGAGGPSLPHRRPRPYPGCPACQVASANDVTWPDDSSLELHQLADHTGGPRW